MTATLYQRRPLAMIPVSTTPQTSPAKKIQKLCPTLIEKVTLSDSFLSVEQKKMLKQCFENGSFFTRQQGAGGLITINDQESPHFALKLSCQELGTTLQTYKNSDSPCAKEGIEPGEAALGEHLSSNLLRQWLQEVSIPPLFISPPASAWGEFAHEKLFNILAPEDLRAKAGSNTYPTGSKGSIHAFERECKCFNEISTEDKKKLDPKAVHLLALFDLSFLQADRNSGNLLVQGTKLIPIDGGHILPRDAASAVTACWKDLPQLDLPLDKSLKNFILKDSTKDMLEQELERLNQQIPQNLIGQQPQVLFAEELETPQSSPEMVEFSPERIKIHKKALYVIQEAVKRDLSLKQITALFIKLDRYSDPVFKELYPHQDLAVYDRFLDSYKSALTSSSFDQGQSEWDFYSVVVSNVLENMSAAEIG